MSIKANVAVPAIVEGDSSRALATTVNYVYGFVHDDACAVGFADSVR